MNIENSRSAQKLRIDEILSLEREPAIEAWELLESNADELNIADLLGFPIEYFRKLIAQEFINKIDDGASFTEFPKLDSELDDICWSAVVANVMFGSPEIVESRLCVQLRLKLLSLHRSGVSIGDAEEKFHLDGIQIRALLMLAIAEEGLTLNEIGKEFGISRERVRQEIKRFGVSARSIRQRQSNEEEGEKATLRESIELWITEHPGCYLSEISTVFNVSEKDVRTLCPQIVRQLVLGTRTKKNSEKPIIFSREQILGALKEAYELKNPLMSMYSVNETRPLTGPYYEKLRKTKVVHGPSQARILQIFGTWKEACNEAGVPCVDAVRDMYELRWTDNELIKDLAEFILSSKSRSTTSFDSWCRLDDSRASSGTIRNQIGEWSESCELALLLLRQRWISE